MTETEVFTATLPNGLRVVHVPGRGGVTCCGVAVNVGCWSHRRGHIIVDKDLNVTSDTHSTWNFHG